MQNSTQKKTTVSLVLGSGGARGLAHIGVIKWLEENNFEIQSISGCSIGSLIGGIYASGKLDQLETWMTSLKQVDVAALLDLSWGSGGLFKGDKVIKTLKDFLGDVLIEDLPIPYTAVAANIITEKEVWINKGSLFDAIRASVSLPLFLTPVVKGDAVLIDGGVLNPVPIAPTFNDKTDLTIAVNLGGPLAIEEVDDTPEIPVANSSSKIQDQLRKYIKSFTTDKKEEGYKKNWSMYQVADKAFDTMQGAIAKMRIASYSPDIEITIARNACGTFDFHRSAEMIQLGYQKAGAAYAANIHVKPLIKKS
jgi:NTE family protein